MVKPIYAVAAGIVLITGVTAFFVLNKKTPGGGLNTINSGEIRMEGNVCEEFPSDWVEEITGKKIIKAEPRNSSTTNVCQYYVDENNFLSLRLNNLSYENQRKGQENLSRTISTDSNIPIEHFVALQENGLINGVYLYINPNQFLAVDRTSTKALTEEEIISFAQAVGERLGNGENVVAQKPVVKEANGVPLPLQTDIIRSFFELINTQRAADAISMMTQRMAGDDSSKQAWGVQFNDMEKVKIVKIENTTDPNVLKVSLEVEMNPRAANAPIPYYGWDSNPNIRFIKMDKDGGKVWRIDEIATGP